MSLSFSLAMPEDDEDSIVVKSKNHPIWKVQKSFIEVSW